MSTRGDRRLEDLAVQLRGALERNEELERELAELKASPKEGEWEPSLGDFRKDPVPLPGVAVVRPWGDAPGGSRVGKSELNLKAEQAPAPTGPDADGWSSTVTLKTVDQAPSAPSAPPPPTAVGLDEATVETVEPKLRSVYRFKIEQVDFEELRVGDLFVMQGGKTDYEDGTRLALARGRIDERAGVQADEVGRLTVKASALALHLRTDRPTSEHMCRSCGFVGMFDDFWTPDGVTCPECDGHTTWAVADIKSRARGVDDARPSMGFPCAWKAAITPAGMAQALARSWVCCLTLEARKRLSEADERTLAQLVWEYGMVCRARHDGAE